MVIDGKVIAERSLALLKEKIAKAGIRKFLAAVLAGEDPASISFLKQKEKTANTLGIDFRLYSFTRGRTQDELRAEVSKIASHKTCGGVIVQLPLPKHVNAQYVLNAIPREKDVDVLGERALGAFYAGRNPALPPAVSTVIEILKSVNFSFGGKKVAVVGVGSLVGKPIATYLMGEFFEGEKPSVIEIFRSRSDLATLKEADLVILGAGKAGLVKPHMLKVGAGVIDFGYDNGKGDFDSNLSAANLEHLAFYTPTPGGTGPILVAKLYENFYLLNSESR